MAFLNSGTPKACFFGTGDGDEFPPCHRRFSRFVHIAGDEIPVCWVHVDMVTEARREALELMAWFDSEDAA